MRGVDQTLRQRLAAAFDHVVHEVLSGPRPPIWPCDPCAFALQDRFRQAAILGDIDLLHSLHSAHVDLLAAGHRLPGLQVICWDDNRLSAVDFALLQGAFQDDIGLTARLVVPETAAAEGLRRAIPRLVSQLDTVLPTWAEEFRAMVHWVVLAQTSEGGFAGASAFAAWGAILVNPSAQPDDLALALTLIHESSHLKLFTAYLDDEIVLNDMDETYSSPLRVEPRPMNGIYHAAFVLARMVCFLKDLRQSGRAEVVLGESSACLDQTLQVTASRFWESFDVIRRHGKLTQTGQSIINEAAAGVGAIRI